ncbi:MAG TPA: sulfatase-like hydrolase/transferase [Thermoanaerobaculia bacterium]|nr:sulfatase-like hydrolase/transferase [Thermoanaerobaculia bacterium]
MNRRTAARAAAVLAFALLGGVLAACGGGATGEAPFAGKNLVVITLDTLRADRLGAYGDTEAHTPHLDALAAAGVRFAHAQAPVPLTLPSHTVMFTGRRPFETGVHINGVHYAGDAETTLAERFSAAGYATGAVISAYVMISKFGLAQGFDSYDDRLTMDDVYRFYAEIPADEAVDRFGRWLDSRPADRPFFGWLHLYDPHQPFEPPAAWAERFPGDPYRGEIAFADEQIGRLLADLERRGVAGETVIVFTSDHGEGFGEHGEIGHGLLAYEETMSVPLVVHAPEGLAGFAAGRTVDERVSLYDLTPTIAELFGLGDEGVDGLPGRSLAPLLFGDPPQGFGDDEAVYFETLAGQSTKGWAPLVGLVSGDMKYMRLPEPELYDLAVDPGETVNLWPERASGDGADMERRLRRLIDEAADGERESERELTSEDRRRLAALGYLSGRGDAGGLDPKRGIEIENRTRDVREQVQAGAVDAAAADLAALRADYPEADFTDFYELEYLIARERGQRQAAIAALERGLAHFPESEPLALRLAGYREEIGDLDGAERGARQLLERDERNSPAVSLLAQVSERRGDLLAALGHYERALELEPGSIPLRVKIAELALKTGDTDRARAAYADLLTEGALDDSPGEMARAAMLEATQGNLPGAEDLLRRVIATEPGGVHHLSLAMVLMRQGEMGEAAVELEAALEAEVLPLEEGQRRLAEQTLGQMR